MKAPAPSDPLTPSAKSPESVTNASEPEASAENIKEEDRDDVDESSSLAAAQAAAQLVAPFRNPVSNKLLPL